MARRARMFEIRSQSHSMLSNVTILYQPLGPRRTAALVHRATFTSNTREMLRRPIPESGTIRTAFKTILETNILAHRSPAETRSEVGRYFVAQNRST